MGSFATEALRFQVQIRLSPTVGLCSILGEKPFAPSEGFTVPQTQFSLMLLAILVAKQMVCIAFLCFLAWKCSL